MLRGQKPRNSTPPFKSMMLDRKDRTRLQSHELYGMFVLLLIGVVIGVGCAIIWRAHGELSRIFVTGTVTLVFGALLGGVVSLLIADFDRRRIQRAAQLEFISNVLSELKSVYDRVDRGRTLIAAHQSAKTYNEQMKEFIDARVKLLAVDRALNFDERGVDLSLVREDVKEMEQYLLSLTTEFIEHYKDISRLQSIYEAQMKAAVEKIDAKLKCLPDNSPWHELATLPRLTDFLQPLDVEQDAKEPISDSLRKDDQQRSNYALNFLRRLDAASKRLRQALQLKLN